MKAPCGSVTRSKTIAAIVVVMLAACGRSSPEVGLPTIDKAALHPKVAQAIAKAEQAVRDEPESAAAWGELGMLAMSHHLPAQAAVCFEKAASLDPKDFRWPYLLGVLAEETDFDAAIAHYRTAIALHTSYVPLRNRLGKILLRMGKLDEAAEQYAYARDVDPQNAFAHFGLGQVALARGDPDSARSAFEQVVALGGPMQRPAWLALVRIFASQGDWSAALRAAQNAARLPPAATVTEPDAVLSEVEARDVLERKFALDADLEAAKGNFAAAAQAYRKLTEERPEFVQAWLNYAQMLLRLRRVDDAVDVYRKTVQRFPQSVRGHYELALALEQAEHLDEAIASYRRCLELKPDFAQAHYNLALLYERQDRLDEAVAEYLRAIESDEAFAPAHLALGVLLDRRGEHERALRYVETAVRLAPGDPVPQAYLKRMQQSTP